MPKINIIELDNTGVRQANESSNVVFVPGYAVMGSLNTPTLCNSVADFELKFGNMPYQFKDTQAKQTFNTYGTSSTTIDNVVLDEAGSYERSYLYAKELLQAGLKVIYTRVFDESKKATFTASTTFTGTFVGEGEQTDTTTLTISVKDYFIGEIGKSVKATVKSVSDKVQQLTVEYPNNTKEIKNFTFDSASVTGNVVYYTDLKDYFSNVDVAFTSGSKDFKFETETKALSFSATSEEEFSVTTMYNTLTSGTIYEAITKGNMDVDFITTGAYPVFEYATDDNMAIKNIILKAYEIQDATALIDCAPAYEREVKDVAGSVLNSVQELKYVFDGDDEALSYSALVPTYGSYKINSTKALKNKEVIMPGSFGYLKAYARSTANNPNYLAIAGTNRGYIPDLTKTLGKQITNNIADTYTKETGVSIIPITYMNPYGYILWGNRTLKEVSIEGIKATNILSIRQLANRVKKVIWATSKKFTFEQNTDTLWINFRSEITPMLDQMVTGGGLDGYNIVKQTSKDKRTIRAVVTLYAVEPVEDWDITVELSNEDTTIIEG